MGDGSDVAAGTEQRVAGPRRVGPLELHGFRAGDAQVIVLAGELDLVTVDDLALAIDVAEVTSARVIVVDLRMLEFVDSAGLRGIVEARRRLEQRLILVRGPRSVHRVFELCGLAERLDFVDRPPPGDGAGDSRGATRRRASQAALAGAIRDLRSRRADRNRPGG
jgi:anti-sigma B factor antagonist